MPDAQTLNLAFRPHTLSGMFGMESMVKSIRKHVATRPPQSWLFHGASGTGKTTIARIMSVAYQCQHMKLWGDPCKVCWSQQDGLAIHEINGADMTGVDEIRKLIEISKHRPMNSTGKRVIIIDEMHKISNAAMNLILKPYEEPPAHLIWIGCTSEYKKLIEALKRRPVTYQLKSLGITATEQFLKKQAERAGIKRPLKELTDACLENHVHSPGFLVAALEKFDAGASALESILTEEPGIDVFNLMKAVCSGNWKSARPYLMPAMPENVRGIRAFAAAWLKGGLIKGTEHKPDRAANSILDLCNMPYDETVALHWLIATLYKICVRYRA